MLFKYSLEEKPNKFYTIQADSKEDAIKKINNVIHSNIVSIKEVKVLSTVNNSKEKTKKVKTGYSKKNKRYNKSVNNSFKNNIKTAKDITDSTYTWKDIVYIKGKYYWIEEQISGADNAFTEYDCKDYFNKIAKRFHIKTTDIKTYMFDNIKPNINEMDAPWELKQCGCYRNGIPVKEYVSMSKERLAEPISMER
jgi:hypothetical protein